MLLIMSAAEAAYLSASSPSLCRVSRPIRNVNIALNSGVNTGQSCPNPRLWLRCHLVRDGVITPGLRVTLPATRGIWEIFHDSKQLISPLRYYSPFLLCILTCGNNRSYLFVKTQPNDLGDKFEKQS